MHNRKEYVVYPPDYTPGDKFFRFKSLLQAKKCALKFGIGATIFVTVDKHPAPFKCWQSSSYHFVAELV